ncbi:sigma-70 family RNA polymerase sigma factor [Haloechinothrix sp. YIM 98757]|uniref:RNA polymerase sigma factor n=1 Tax=Haloechinothrix aidingensis TaxID=2752311 RepID=A0A838A4X2_9PSEU|nr:sigma-70 family RNA polymerase sigma factor [Haloechinothrix aidingensis]MBA0123988.1 sigma-70 family RNA polymerase sigma factor [Haloechinothrix aidingensis]
MTAVAEKDEFLSQADSYRHELLAHCYRMLGSVYDAEDLVQDTYLRAWRSYGSFEGRSSVRTWLYRIATNTCLTALESRNRRPLPTGLGGPSPEPETELSERTEVPWLEPLPDDAIDSDGADPAAVAVSRESVRLALVAALQHLPPRQRAVLILRDVLKWRAAEVADLLDISTAAVNSSLQRARAQLAKVAPDLDSKPEPLSPEQRDLLDRYVTAFEMKDINEIVSLFTSEAVWEMPPYPEWFVGAENIGRVIDSQCPAGPDDMRLIRTNSNGRPAFGVYMRDATDGAFHPFQIQVLEFSGEAVGHVVTFFDLRLFETFGLPEVYPADGSAGG